MITSTEVAIIGAGPSGSIAAALLKKLGHQVTILEQSAFPRFSIGESLLPHCMEFIEEAGMAEAVAAEKFQVKNGAAFIRDDKYGSFDFSQKSSSGPSLTHQVQRAIFDQSLANSALEQGVDIQFRQKIESVSIDENGNSTLHISDQSSGDNSTLSAQYLLDASGFGRVLPRLLDLECPSDFPSRRSVFTHIKDNISDASHERDKILIAIHPQYRDVWYWLIPFSNGVCSVGVVGEDWYFDNLGTENLKEILQTAIDQSTNLKRLLSDAEYITDVQSITGYSSNVSSLHGKGFALLGNAGEFLDPVFSSGVTIAMKSASLAAPLVSRQLNGNSVDWQKEYALPLKTGIDTFRAFVKSWYQGSLQDIIFADNQSASIREKICSILAGFAWDSKNPFVQEPERRLKALAELCANS